jgi:hypothetical protein
VADKDEAVQMKCSNHPTIESTFVCHECGKSYCEACKVTYEGVDYCTNCRRLTVSVVLTRLRTWRIPATAAVLIGMALAYSIFTGLVYAYSNDVFSSFIYGAPRDRLIMLAIAFVAGSTLAGGFVSGILSRGRVVNAGFFCGLLLITVHIAVDFRYDYFELPLTASTTNFQRLIGMSYYVMLAAAGGTIGGLIASRIRRRS